MGEYYTERNRRGQPWRAYENVRDDDREDERGNRRGQRRAGQEDWQPEDWQPEDRQPEDWQPEREGNQWDDARRRQRLAPGQLSDGGPARSGYTGSGHAGSGYADNEYRGSEYGGSGQRRRTGWANSESSYPYRQRDDWAGSDLRYGLNGGYGRPETSSADDWQWNRMAQRRGRARTSDFGDFEDREDSGGGRRHERDGERDYERGYDPSGAQGFGSADQAWLRAARHNREPLGQRGGHEAYFNELRSDRRYWTGSGDDWEDREDDRDDRGNRGEEHGMLYNLGHRIGEAVGDWFGPGAEEKERRSGPRGFTRSDERIRDQICERLTFANGVDVSDVSVDVKSGVVTLSGTVRLRSQKYDIEDIADNTFGVTEVENNIRVQKQPTTDEISAGFNGS